MSSWVRRRDVLWRRLLDGAVLLPVEAAEPFVLDAPGAAVWSILDEDEPLALADAAAVLAEASGESVARIAADIEPLLEQLEELGAVRRVTG